MARRARSIGSAAVGLVALLGYALLCGVLYLK